MKHWCGAAENGERAPRKPDPSTMMQSVLVRTARPYSVHVGEAVLSQVHRELAFRSRCALLSDELIASGLVPRMKGLDSHPLMMLPPGESAKNLTTVEAVLGFMVDSKLDRRSCLVTLGGGVLTDVGGLAASLYMRGISVIHCPTTLLAQVDSSVGGKTGVNLAGGKNLAGTFHQPSAVYADTSALRTLPDPEFRSGLGEVVKTALLTPGDLLSFIEQHRVAILERDPGCLADLVAQTVKVKADLVSQDEHEMGRRKLLNLGHTFGHAIEHAAGYGRVPHGEAVAVGTVLALRASRRLGVLVDVALLERVSQLLRTLGLESSLSGLREKRGLSLTPEQLRMGMRHDKKGTADRPSLVLPKALGEIETDVVPEEVFWTEFLQATDL